MKSSGTQQSLSELGGNRTGIQTSPELAQELIDGAASATPSMEGGPELADAERAEYIKEGFPIGSLPSMAFGTEAKVDDESFGVAIFLDKLSERLAFERMGTRLYDALINKCETLDDGGGAPSVAELQVIRDEEHRHFLLLNESITLLGGDPTVQSPCANVAAVASMGIMQVLMDPRTSVSQCLQAILTAELTDNAGWEMLIDLAEDLGHAELSDKFTEALDNEQKHLLNVQTWLSDRTMSKL